MCQIISKKWSGTQCDYTEHRRKCKNASPNPLSKVSVKAEHTQGGIRRRSRAEDQAEVREAKDDNILHPVASPCLVEQSEVHKTAWLQRRKSLFLNCCCRSLQCARWKVVKLLYRILMSHKESMLTPDKNKWMQWGATWSQKNTF